MNILSPEAPASSSEACAESLLLLHRNLTPRGVIAASRTPVSERRNYARIFSRDASICALGMSLSGDPLLHAGAVNGLFSLAERQAGNGQLPNFIDPESGETDYWYLGCIDATLWWLAAVDFLDRHAPREEIRLRLQSRIDGAIAWLRCQEHPKLLLLRQDEASDWADIMPRSGFVLATNALWYHVKRRYGVADADGTKRHFNQLFFPFSGELPEDRRLRLLTHYVRGKGRRGELYLSFVNFSTWGEEGDVFGNLLAVLFGLAGEGRSARILDALKREGVDDPMPVRAVCSPIRKEDPLWREYMGRHRQNAEYQYHNGGAWPFLGGFWAIVLSAQGRTAEAREALCRLGGMNRRNGWGFHEWFHGVTGEPQGMAGQSWNAAMFLLACRSLERKLF